MEECCAILTWEWLPLDCQILYPKPTILPQKEPLSFEAKIKSAHKMFGINKMVEINKSRKKSYVHNLPLKFRQQMD